jgi:hypothetical protein
MTSTEIIEFIKDLSSATGKQVVTEKTDDPDKMFVSPMLLKALSREELMSVARSDPRLSDIAITVMDAKGPSCS